MTETIITDLSKVISQHYYVLVDWILSCPWLFDNDELVAQLSHTIQVHCSPSSLSPSPSLSIFLLFSFLLSSLLFVSLSPAACPIICYLSNLCSFMKQYHVDWAAR